MRSRKDTSVLLGKGSEVRELLLAVPAAKPEFLTPLLGHFSDQPKHSDPKLISSLPASVMIEALTQRELEVLRLVAEGLSNEEIGTQLYISLGTLKVVIIRLTNITTSVIMTTKVNGRMEETYG